MNNASQLNLNADTVEDLILHRDGLILVINKPPHIPVHAGPKGGENMEQYFSHLQFGLPHPPALAHRLDRDTAGCLVLGRHKKALRKMGKLFQSGNVEKTYWAVVEGNVESDSGTIDLPMAKRSKDKRSWWMKTDPDGQEAITAYRVLGRGNNMSWLELAPKTGRTHQLRVHTQAIAHPIIGDSIYGNGPKHSPVPTLHLLARSIKYSRKLFK